MIAMVTEFSMLGTCLKREIKSTYHSGFYVDVNITLNPLPLLSQHRCAQEEPRRSMTIPSPPIQLPHGGHRGLCCRGI